MAQLTIGTVQLDGRFIMAPMAGVTDRAFRQICREHGAALTVSEMISTKALLFQDKKTRTLLSLAPNEVPGCIQIFGSDPESMADGARKAQEISGAAIVDINMGCPAPKIVRGGDGSALMRTPETAEAVIRAVVEAVHVPVTVKFRKGWDGDNENFLDFARMAESCGAAAVTIHGRTREQMYAGKADWDAIAAVKRAVSIPVIANGDVFSEQDAIAILEHTGADGVMIGRGALGNPWLFERCRALSKATRAIRSISIVEYGILSSAESPSSERVCSPKYTPPVSSRTTSKSIPSPTISSLRGEAPRSGLHTLAGRRLAKRPSSLRRVSNARFSGR